MATQRRAAVLVVDDHEDTLELVADLLRREGFEVRTASGYRDALRAARAHGCDLLVSDLYLGDGDGDGCELLRAVRAGGPVSAVALTGWWDAGTDRWARAAGFRRVVFKPFVLGAVLAAVRDAAGAERCTLPARRSAP
jgi:CheY-like chemotaxis protein